jgi:hypothetical protein
MVDRWNKCSVNGGIWLESVAEMLPAGGVCLETLRRLN